MKSRVEGLLKTAREMQIAGDVKYDSVDFDDDDLRVKLERIARSREPTISDLDHALQEIASEFRENTQRHAVFVQRCHERRDDLRVFYVVNTANRQLTVIAHDTACARYFAHSNGHIQDRTNGKVLVMKKEKELELRRSGSALGRALRDGFPGVVKQVGRNVVNELSKKVYTPMTVVE